MRTEQTRPIYIIDVYCARRLRGLLEQLVEVFDEALARRRYDPAGELDLGLEEVDMAVNASNFKAEEFDELF